MSVLIRNCRYIDYQDFSIRKGHLLVTEKDPHSLQFFSQEEEIPVETLEEAEIVEGKNQFAMKAWGNAHHHAYSLLARGMPFPKVPPQNFSDILQSIWWKLDCALDEDMIYASALGTALECAKAGVAFVVDHHSSPSIVGNSLELVRKGFEEVGLGHLLCLELSDRNGQKILDENLESQEEYLSHHSERSLIGLHASFTVNDKLLDWAVGKAERYNTGLHIHVAEDFLDQELTLKNYGKRVISRLESKGALNGPKTILAHCLHLDDLEWEKLMGSKAWVAVCGESNSNNAVGSFNGPKEEFSRILLGTDGMHSNMLMSGWFHYLNSHQNNKLDLAEAYKRLRNIHHYTAQNCIPGDGINNLVIFDLPSPTEIHRGNLLSQLLFGKNSLRVNALVSQGKVVLDDGKLVSSNEEEVLNFCRQQGKRLWKKLSE